MTFQIHIKITWKKVHRLNKRKMSDNMNNSKKIIYSDEDLKALRKTLKEVKKLNFNHENVKDIKVKQKSKRKVA